MNSKNNEIKKLKPKVELIIIEDDEEYEDEDAEFGKPNRNKNCSACSELIVGKYEFTGGQYAENEEPLCRACWDKPQHSCFNSCYKNSNGLWWCEDDEDEEDEDQNKCRLCKKDKRYGCDCPVFCFQCSQCWRPSQVCYHHCKVEVNPEYIEEVNENSLDTLFTALRNEIGAEFYDRRVHYMTKVHWAIEKLIKT